MACENQGAFKVSPIWKKLMMRGGQIRQAWHKQIPTLFEEPQSPHPDSMFPLELRTYVLSILKSKLSLTPDPELTVPPLIKADRNVELRSTA